MLLNDECVSENDSVINNCVQIDDTVCYSTLFLQLFYFLKVFM